MRTTLFIASSILIVACAWGEESGPPDEDPEIPVCGDGTCDSGETTSNCASDCSTATQCGNNVCESGEDTTSCPGDCQTQSGIDCDDGLIQFACGVCLGSGTCELGTSEDACLACLTGGGGAGCSGGVPNGTCDSGEDPTNCPFDCM